jgi:hypothetical protein
MSKVGSHDPFGHFKHKLWQKEKSKVKLTIKSQESPWFPYVHVVCNIPLECSWQGLQLCFKPHLNRRFADKIMGPQSHGSPNFENFGTPKAKSHLGVNPMARRRVYYKGEGDGFPQVWAIVNLVSLRLPMARPSTKSALTMH